MQWNFCLVQEGPQIYGKILAPTALRRLDFTERVLELSDYLVPLLLHLGLGLRDQIQELDAFEVQLLILHNFLFRLGRFGVVWEFFTVDLCKV